MNHKDQHEPEDWQDVVVILGSAIALGVFFILVIEGVIL